MFHTLVVAALVVPFTVFGAAVHILQSLISRNGPSQRAFERFWFGAVLRIARVRVDVRGYHHLRPGRSYVIMANHRSWFDIPALHWALGDHDIRWVGKSEIGAVPFFGWAFALSRHIAIDRRDRERGVRAIRRAAEVSGGGVSIVIFPEGTRSLEASLLPFKKGGFHLAVDTGLEILPVGIRGTERVMAKQQWKIRPGAVEIVVCEPIASAGCQKSELRQLMDVVRGSLQIALDPRESRTDEGAHA